MPEPGDAPLRRARPRSALLAALLGWVVPGLGQVYVGRPAKGVLFLAVVGGTYALGLHLAGSLCVNPDRDPIWFAGQCVAVGPTVLTAWLTRNLAPVARIPTYDVGLLYVTVASLLNAVVVADGVGTVAEEARERAEMEEMERAAAAEGAAGPSEAAPAPGAATPEASAAQVDQRGFRVPHAAVADRDAAGDGSPTGAGGLPEDGPGEDPTSPAAPPPPTGGPAEPTP